MDPPSCHQSHELQIECVCVCVCEGEALICSVGRNEIGIVIVK